MKTSLSLLMLCALLLAFPELKAVSAETEDSGKESSVQNESELDSLLNKVFLAYGGKDNLAKFESNCLIVGEQKNLADSPDKKFGFRLQRKGDQIRIDVDSESGWTSTVYDGVRAWKMIGKTVSDLDPDQTQALYGQREHELSVLSHLGDKNYRFKLIGNTMHRAVPVFAVEMSKAGNAPTTFYIDQKNYLVVGASYPNTDSTSGNQVEITLDYSEYRPSAGSLVPFKQVTFVNDKATQEVNLQTLEFDRIKDDELFRRPDRPNDLRLAKAIVLPFLYSHKEILVKIRINESEPLDFLIDTGATQTLIDRRAAAELLLDRQNNLNFNAAGGTFIAQSTEINKMELASNAVLRGIQAAIVDLSGQARQLGKPIAGVLGSNVLSHFAVSIDYGKSQIKLNDYYNFKPASGANLVTFDDKKGPVVKALINGKEEISFLIDTGAAFNNLPPAVAKKLPKAQSSHSVEGIGADGKPVRLGTLSVSNIKLGSTIVRDVPFTYAMEQDQGNLKRGFVAGSSIGILGNPFWQNFIITLDYRLHQMVLQANPLLASRQELEQLVNTGDSKLNIYRDYRAAETAYQSALNKVQQLSDPRQQARLWGRLGNLRRIMAKDLNRPEQAKIAYEYFSKARSLAHQTEDREIEGRILGDWALLYMDNGQGVEARRALDGALLFAPQDPQVNVNFAVYLNKLHSYGDMRAYVDKALFLEPSNWQALWYKLKLWEIFNDTIHQKEALKEILHYYPWSRVAQEKLKTLNAPQGQPL